MKVRELIAALRECNPDEDVFVAYDSASVVMAVEPGQIVRVEASRDGDDGIWVFAEGLPVISSAIERGDIGRMSRIVLPVGTTQT